VRGEGAWRPERLKTIRSDLEEKNNGPPRRSEQTREPQHVDLAQARHCCWPRVGGCRWVILAFVFFATTLNYADSVMISVLKPSLSAEFRWSELDYSNMYRSSRGPMRSAMSCSAG
jgi:hypothetical protein